MSKKEKKKTSNVGNIIMMIILMVMSAACGALSMDVLEGIFKSIDNTALEALLIVGIIATLYLAVFLQMAIHEGGHLIFGLLTGYQFLSYRIGSFMWIKEEDGIHFKKFSLAGTGGQCLMAPPELVEGDMPVVLYNLGGVIVNFLCGAIGFCVFYFCSNPYVKTFMLINAIVAIGLGLMNGLPLKGMVNTDGSNAIELAKDQSARKAFWVQLMVSEIQARGKFLREIPEEYFSTDGFPDGWKSNTIMNAVCVFKYNRMMEEFVFDVKGKSLEEIIALPSYDKIVGHLKELIDGDIEVVDIYQMVLKNDLIYFEALKGCDETAKSLEKDKGYERFIKAMKNAPSILRTQYAYARLCEKDEKKANDVMENFLALEKRYPYKADFEMEKTAMELVK